MGRKSPAPLQQRRQSKSTEEKSELQAEVAGGVVVADVFYHGAEEIFAVGEFAAFDISAQKIAKDAAEIFVAGERHEGTRIRHHADETRKQAGVGERV